MEALDRSDLYEGLRMEVRALLRAHDLDEQVSTPTRYVLAKSVQGFAKAIEDAEVGTPVGSTREGADAEDAEWEKTFAANREKLDSMRARALKAAPAADARDAARWRDALKCLVGAVGDPYEGTVTLRYDNEESAMITAVDFENALDAARAAADTRGGA